MGDYEPRGSTDDYGRHSEPHENLHNHAHGEGTDPPPPPEHTVEGADGFAIPTKDERTWALFAHLGGLVVSLFSGLGFIVPLVIWLTQKEESEFVDDQGREALNFQLTALIIGGVGGFIAVILALVTAGLAMCLFIPLLFAFMAYILIFGIIASIQANEGKRYRYPFCIRIL